MSRMSSVVRSTSEFVTDAAEAVSRINDHMCARAVEGRFVTFVLVILDMARHKAAALAQSAADAGRQAADRASRKTAELTETATQAVEDVRSKAAEWTGAPSDRSWQSASPTLGASPLHAADPERLYPNGYYRGDVDREGNGSLPMDRILLGAAGVAVAAAVALAHQRRSAGHPSPDDLFGSG